MLSPERSQTAKCLFDGLQYFFVDFVLKSDAFSCLNFDVQMDACKNLDTIFSACSIQNDTESFELLHLVFFSLEIEIDHITVHPDLNLLELVHALCTTKFTPDYKQWDVHPHTQYHGHLLSRFLAFFSSNSQFMRCAVYKTKNTVEGLSVVPPLFLTLMSASGFHRAFDVLLQFDVTENARWAYKTVGEFFVYLHENYSCVENNSKKVSHNVYRLYLSERLERLKLILKHNGKPFLMTVFAWDYAPITHLGKTSRGTMAGFYIQNSMQVLSAHTRLSKTMFPKPDVGATKTHGYDELNSYMRAFKMIVDFCPEALAVKYSTQNTSIKNSFECLECMWSRRRELSVFASRIHFLTYRDIHTVVQPHMTVDQFTKERNSVTGLTIQEQNDQVANDPILHEKSRVILKIMRDDFLLAVGMMSNPKLAIPHLPNKTLLFEIVWAIGNDVMRSMDQKIAAKHTHNLPSLWLTSRGPGFLLNYKSDNDEGSSASESSDDEM